MTKEQRLVEKMRADLQKQFAKVGFMDRVKLFTYLKDWADSDMGDKERELFLEALYSAPITQDIQIYLGVDRAVKEVLEDERK